MLLAENLQNQQSNEALQRSSVERQSTHKMRAEFVVAKIYRVDV